MDASERHALASREIRIGLIDLTLWDLAIREAKGVRVYAQQIYLERRVKRMQEEYLAAQMPTPDLFFRSLVKQVELAERKARRRYRLAGWMWVFICFSSATGSSIFLYFAGVAASHEDYRFVRDALLAVAFIFVGIASFIRVKRIEVMELRLSR
jgi:hypothetical protein